MNLELIRRHLDRINLDIRIRKDARWIDQKCTPDVVCIIADCVINFVENTGATTFTVADIWNSPYFTQNVMELFSKPHPDNPAASSEYDKFIQQPLRMLAYAGILAFQKIGNTNHYSVEKRDILEFIALKDRNAFGFLCEYITKVLQDSGLTKYFETYKSAYLSKRGEAQAFQRLKKQYEDFILQNTPINQPVEIRRIFAKVINPYAVMNQIAGTKSGRMSTRLTSYSDLLYNQINWRDIGKEKQLTRQEYEEIAVQPETQAITRYYIQKAKKQIARKYSVSEVSDEFAYGEATQVHHIFPENEFPRLAAYLENLIKLTAQQHFTRAHPSNKTFLIDRDYQLVCLLAKSESIQFSLERGEEFYNKGDFIYVINNGVYDDIVDESLSFEAIRGRLVHFYNAT